MSKRFADDVRELPPHLASKIDKVLESVRQHGVNHPPLRTRDIKGNPDKRFRLMDIDDKYRIVAVIEGNEPLFLRAGNHDETIEWGAHATLAPYLERLALTSETFRRKEERRIVEDQPILIEMTTSLPEILEHAEELSDLVTSDLYGNLEGYRDGSIEDWMIFLSPLQKRAVQRAVEGPSRISGGPGTGKTVVGLHRAASFARAAADSERVLVTSFVRTVPEVLDGLFERLAPDVHSRVDFKGIHQLAGTILHDRGIEARIDDVAAKARFDDRMTADPGRSDALARAGFGARYLWDEITRVIEGREVEDLDGYLRLARHGRHQPMQELERRAVWQLYSEYRDACNRGDPPIASWTQHLTLARAALVDRPWTKRYRAIVVDEAQDVTQAGVRLLTDLVSGGAAGQLLLIGDNAQRIYPGGFRLRDLDLEVRGRSFILDTCYRSTHEIMQAANALGRYLSSDDFGEEGVRGVEWRTSRYGPRPALRDFRSVQDERSWLTGEIASLAAAERDAVGVLVRTNNLADNWSRELKAAGVVVCDLTDYKGRAQPGVKVGTYNRAKGLEFTHVFLPNLSRFGLPVDAGQLDEVILRGSQLYVGMTRARDRLDLSYAGEPSLYVEPLRDHVDIALETVGR